MTCGGLLRMRRSGVSRRIQERSSSGVMSHPQSVAGMQLLLSMARARRPKERGHALKPAKRTRQAIQKADHAARGWRRRAPLIKLSPLAMIFPESRESKNAESSANQRQGGRLRSTVGGSRHSGDDMRARQWQVLNVGELIATAPRADADPVACPRAAGSL